MGYPTLLVHLELDRANAGMLALAGGMAARFHSRVVGIAAGQPIAYASGDGYVPGDMIQQDIVDMEKRIGALEAEYRAAFAKSNIAIEWRSTVTYGPLADYLAKEARCADLILTGSPGKKGPTGTVVADVGALVLQAGRPVLVVPAATKTLKLGKVVVCWRDTREARRAVVDSLGLLKQADAVDLVEVTSDDLMAATRSRLQDVVAWLGLNGVSATPIATPADGNERATLASFIEERGADIVVAGAYGHSRMHEWALGGVTRDLWMHSDHCSLLSH